MISKSHSSWLNIPQTSKCAPARAYFIYGGFIPEDAEVFIPQLSWHDTTACAGFHLATDNRQNGDHETKRERHFSPRGVGSPLPVLQWQSPAVFPRFRSLAYHSPPGNLLEVQMERSGSSLAGRKCYQLLRATWQQTGMQCISHWL